MHLLDPRVLFFVLWVAWGVSWIAAAFWSSPAQATAATWDVWLYRGLTVLGGILLAVGRHRTPYALHLWSVGYRGAQILALLTIPGFLFAWWARLHLGTIWSSSVTRKEVHRVVDTGPYALVRHPIYTGLLEACLVTSIASGTVISMLGLGAVATGFWVKARLEERFLEGELGADAYGAYRRRVPMLLPIRLGQRGQ